MARGAGLRLALQAVGRDDRTPRKTYLVNLVRIAGLILKPSPEPFGRDFFTDGIRVQIEATPVVDGGRWHIATAQVKLRHVPKRTGDGYVVIPDAARRRGTSAIEVVSNLLSLHHGCSRRLSSPSPYLAFEPETKDERKWLEESLGVLGGLAGQTQQSSGQSIPLTDDTFRALEDRWDGVALLADGRATDRLVSRFVYFLRLIERAFRLPAPLVVAPLLGFLDSRFGYTREELTHWMGQLRGSATHADRRNDLLVDAQVVPYLHRAEQAAWDVLMNKAVWRDPSPDRRAAWEPTSGLASPAGELVAMVGSTLSLQMSLFDRWREFPLELERHVTIPESWWPHPVETPAAEPATFLAVRKEDWPTGKFRL